LFEVITAVFGVRLATPSSAAEAGPQSLDSAESSGPAIQRRKAVEVPIDEREPP